MKINKNLKETRKSLKVDAKRVVILGAGRVGGHISKRLSNENYNVILIDDDEEKIKEARLAADIGTYIGNGCNAEIYVDINLEEEDLFIAVTDSDETNLIACHIAKAFGCGIKIARVRQSFYKNFGDHSLGTSFWRKLGVEILLNQDEITSKEILQLVENPGSIEAIDLGREDIQLVAYRVKENSLLCGRRLIGLKDVPMFDNALVVAALRSNVHSKSHSQHKSPIHIKAPTERGFWAHPKKGHKEEYLPEETLIPKGDFRIQEGDVLYISGLKKDFEDIGQLFDADSTKEVKHVFILSGSSLAPLLAENLIKKYPGKDIYLITKEKGEAYNLRDQINSKIHVLLIDVHNIQHLINEGLDENCIFIGASNNEDDNVLACLLAKEETGTKTIAIIQSGIYTHVLPYLEIDAAVSPKMLLVDDVLKALRKNVYDVLFSKGSGAEVLEFIVEKSSVHSNQMLKNIELPEKSIVAAVVRGEKTIIPRGSTLIVPGDHVIIFTLKEAVRDVQDFFAE